jgi:hypothetical protein
MFESIFHNWVQGELGEGVFNMPKQTVEYIHNQTDWINYQIRKHTSGVYYDENSKQMMRREDNGKVSELSEDNQYWLAVECVMKWVEGMWDGLQDSNTTLTYDQFIALPYMADLEDILDAYPDENSKNTPHFIKKKMKQLMMGDCTIIMKDVEDDILAAHTTHNEYQQILRLFKSTTINWESYAGFMNTKTIRNSCRYGGIGSKDDFYILDNGMIVMETSILIFNNSLYELIEYNTVPYFIRATVSHWMSSNNEEWINTFIKHNSGTHVAQWVLIDGNKQKYDNNTVNLLDIIMDDYESFDITQKFKEQGYWASYNVPYSQRIWKTCNYDPDTHSFTNDERAVIIKKHAHEVEDEDDLRRLIRLNENSTYPCGGIAPRCDLDPRHELRRAFGAIDVKYSQVSWVAAKDMTMKGLGSPTTTNTVFTPFTFDGEWDKVCCILLYYLDYYRVVYHSPFMYSLKNFLELLRIIQYTTQSPS